METYNKHSVQHHRRRRKYCQEACKGVRRKKKKNRVVGFPVIISKERALEVIHLLKPRKEVSFYVAIKLDVEILSGLLIPDNLTTASFNKKFTCYPVHEDLDIIVSDKNPAVPIRELKISNYFVSEFMDFLRDYEDHDNDHYLLCMGYKSPYIDPSTGEKKMHHDFQLGLSGAVDDVFDDTFKDTIRRECIEETGMYIRWEHVTKEVSYVFKSYVY